MKSVKQEHEGCLHHHQERLQLRHFPKALSFGGSQRVIFSAARGMSFQGNNAQWAFTGGQAVVSYIFVLFVNNERSRCLVLSLESKFLKLVTNNATIHIRLFTLFLL